MLRITRRPASMFTIWRTWRFSGLCLSGSWLDKDGSRGGVVIDARIRVILSEQLL
jgi:hypothetical protein